MDPSAAPRPGRNDPCRCGSGKKYKQCCLDKDEAALRAARANASEAEPAPATGAAAPAPPSGPRPATHQPWKKGSATNTRGFQRMSTPRKVGGG